MASYKEIFGTNIEVLASDPANPIEGQVWYNSTENVVKGDLGPLVGAWSTLADMNQGAVLGRSGGGSTTSTIYAGGDESGAPEMRGYSETWNGTTWTEVSDLGTARAQAHGAATSSTAAIAAGGFTNSGPNDGVVATSESWNGSTWTGITSLSLQRRLGGTAGNQTSALVFSGAINDPTKTVNNESWNGSSWTELNNVNTARDGLRGAGADNTAAIGFGGRQPPGAIRQKQNLGMVLAGQ